MLNYIQIGFNFAPLACLELHYKIVVNHHHLKQICIQHHLFLTKKLMIDVKYLVRYEKLKI